MNFFNSDIDAFLKSALPLRFQDISPYEFEDFIAFLFEENGYNVEQTDYSADFGADLITEKNGVRVAVQVKRYAESTKVGVHDINQVIGAANYYGTDEQMLITCSSITRAAKILAEETGVLIWEWEDLLAIIQDTFLGGESYYDYFELSMKPKLRKLAFDLEITSIEYDQNTHKGDQSIVLTAELTNNSAENLYLKLQKPIYIGKNKKQYTAVDWMPDYFNEGLVFSDSKVEMGFIFLSRQVEKFAKGDRIIIHCLDKSDQEIFIIDQHLKKVEGSCFIVSHCYGRDSEAYDRFIFFRERYLKTNILGIFLIKTYYRTSPILVSAAESNKYIMCALNALVILILHVLILFNVNKK